MQARQCKYVNVFVYSFHLVPFSSSLPPHPRLLMRQPGCHPMWSLHYQAGVHLGTICWASILNSATQKALDVFAGTFDIAE